MVQHIAAIEGKGGLAHASIDALIVQVCKFVPLSDDAQRMRAGTCLRSRHCAVSSGNMQGRQSIETVMVPVLLC